MSVARIFFGVVFGATVLAAMVLFVAYLDGNPPPREINDAMIVGILALPLGMVLVSCLVRTVRGEVSRRRELMAALAQGGRAQRLLAAPGLTAASAILCLTISAFVQGSVSAALPMACRAPGAFIGLLCGVEAFGLAFLMMGLRRGSEYLMIRRARDEAWQTAATPLPGVRQ